MGDRRKCQTYTASPAEPGGLPVMLACTTAFSANPLRNPRESIFRKRPILPLHQATLRMTSAALISVPSIV